MLLVKVQLPLATNDTVPKALIYTHDHKLEMMYPITDHIREQMRGRPKAFFEIELRASEPLLVREVTEAEYEGN